MTCPPVMRQTWVVSAILMSMLGQGMIMGSSSCLLDALQTPWSTIEISIDTASWLVAIISIGNMFGYIIASVSMAAFGRKLAFSLCLLPSIAGMLLVINATDATSLIWGRLLAGIAAGGTCTVGAVVIGEYCSPRYRGMFLNMKTAGLNLGSLVAHVLVYHMHWKTVTILCLMPYTIALIIGFTWPESPSWLAQRSRFKESEDIFYQLRGKNKDSTREIVKLIRTQKDGRRTMKRTFCEKCLEFTEKFSKRNFVKPILIFIFTAILLETSGRHTFPAYATQIVIQITGNNSHTFYYTFAADMIITVSALFSSYLIKVMKLRKLLFSTGLASCIMVALGCSYLYLVEKDIVPNDYPMIPASLFGLYFMFANFGCIPVPLALMGEILPLEHREVGAAIAGYLISCVQTIVLKLMPFLMQTLKIYGAFSVQALSTAISLIFLYFMLPETKNKTLQEIEDFFNYDLDENRKMRSETDEGQQMICKNP